METFTALMNLLQKGLVAYGTYHLIFGGMKLAEAINTKTGPDFTAAIGGLVSGVIICTAAYLVTTITF